jgi:MFS transporter, ACS family, D-galactonate transporter
MPAMETAGVPANTRALGRVLILLGLSAFLNYIDRSNLSLAASLLKDELGLSPSRLGVLLSAFFWTYAGCQLLAGWLVDRFDVKWVFAAGFLLWSTATAVTGTLHTFAALLVIRILLGAGESVSYPAYSKIIASHFQENQRGFANSVISIGLYFGPAVGLLLGGPLVSKFGWRPFFVVLGLVSLVWLLPWSSWMPATPREPGELRTFSILSIVKQKSALGTCVGLFCINYCVYFSVTWLPFYLVRERNFSLTQMAWVGGAFFITAATSAVIWGDISDRWIRAGATPTRARKTIMAVSGVAFGFFIALAVFAPRQLSVVLLILAGASLGGSSSNVWAITQRLAGKQAVGRWCGLQLFLANLSGIIAPALTGYLVDRSGHFYSAFLVMAAVAALGSLSWVYLIGPIEPINWSANIDTGDAA